MSEELSNPLAGMFAMVDQEAGLEDALNEAATEQDETVAEDETKVNEEKTSESTEKSNETDDAKQVDNKGESADTQAEQVILSKDGKHTIPFNVLEGERAKREAAETMAHQLQQQLDALQASQNAETTNSNTQGNAETALLDEETLKEVEEVFPGLAKGLRAQNEQLKALSNQVLEERTLRQQQSEETVINTEKADAEKALNENEKLIFMRDNRPDLWEEAKRLDNTLMKLPEYQNVSKAERFKDVTRLIELKHGEVMTPSQATEVAQVEQKEVPKVVVKKQPIPSSLSDIPSGEAQTEQVTLQTAGATQARQMLKGLTSDQILARINAS